MPLNISTDRGQTVVDPASLPAGTVIAVCGTVPLPVKRALRALTVPAANRLTMASVAGVVVGMAVAGTNVPGGATVAAVDTATKQVKLSANVSGTVASGATITFSKAVNTTADAASGSSLAVPTAGLSVGMTATGTNIAGGATIASIDDAGHVTLNAAVTADVPSGTTITFALAGGRATAAATTTASVAPLGLQVVAARNDGLLGTEYENVVGAMVYNERTITFTALARAVARGWSLVPMANVTPAAPTYL